jgi:hypothetical protein
MGQGMLAGERAPRKRARKPSISESEVTAQSIRASGQCFVESWWRVNSARERVALTSSAMIGTSLSRSSISARSSGGARWLA